ncbi:RagB/SusD family nutrient uptake outer membrane protein [Paraflavisolibacter sp. H34]|uniref:RagB/SusD family nutrient uptake outer membrane protein n=1 Tax=Huijunlia imazamoxiresistens TaxID=3127457 RepID=UPI003016EB08
MKKIFFAFTLALAASGCSKLDEQLKGDLTEQQALANPDINSMLKGCYNALRAPYMDLNTFFALQEVTSDAAIVPTRGPDWDDNGQWRVLHAHNWNADHIQLASTFKNLLQAQYACTNLLRFNPPARQAAEARFLRAFTMLSVLDAWGQVPFREAGEDLLQPAKVLHAPQALDFIISEATAALPHLPATGATRANQDAARMLLMKCLLNKGAFLDRAHPSFDAADMDRVIALAGEISATGRYALSANYYDNFAPKNNLLSKENIFTGENLGGVEGGFVNFYWKAALHINQAPSGWNGFSTLSDFYDKFESADKRRGGDYPGMTEVAGIKAGFLVGPQYDQNGKQLADRKGNLLSFQRDVRLIETGHDLEMKGIRAIKYPIDYAHPESNADNDFVFYRYADVLLMKAEALWRSGRAAEALALVNEVRGVRGVRPMAALTADGLLDELGREFYWEAHRRTDLIRFGKWLLPWQEKEASDPRNLLFPIPAQQLAVNPNLQQNPGYATN